MLGERLQELRKDHGLSQQDLADKLNVSIHTISSYERNRSVPDDTMKMEIAKLFDISLDYLLGLVDEPYSFHRAENCMLLPAEFEDAEKKELREYIAFLRFKRARKKQRKAIPKNVKGHGMQQVRPRPFVFLIWNCRLLSNSVLNRFLRRAP